MFPETDYDTMTDGYIHTPRIHQSRVAKAALLACLLATAVGQGAVADRVKGEAAADRIVLPPMVYATPDIPASIYIHDVVIAEPTDVLNFGVMCDLGTMEPGVCWTVTPTDVDVGDHALSIRLVDPGDDKSGGSDSGRRDSGPDVAAASTVVRVAPADAGADRDIALLIVGDSLTHASQYPNEIARLLSLPNNPRWRMLGTHRPEGVADGVAHEGYGGWTWARFNTQYDANNTQVGSRGNSPFVFADDAGMAPRLDIPRYVRDKCEGRAPDYVVFMLGINDCFHVDPADPAAIDARIDATLAEAKLLLAAFREATPAAELGVCLTTAPNARDGAFEANYKGKYTRSGWRRIQQRLVEKQIAQFRDRASEHIFIVPTSLCLDPVAGYPENNAVHPNAVGYQQVGRSIYAWLKYRLAQR